MNHKYDTSLGEQRQKIAYQPPMAELIRSRASKLLASFSIDAAVYDFEDGEDIEFMSQEEFWSRRN